MLLTVGSKFDMPVRYGSKPATVTRIAHMKARYVQHYMSERAEDMLRSRHNCVYMQLAVEPLSAGDIAEREELFLVVETNDGIVFTIYQNFTIRRVHAGTEGCVETDSLQAPPIEGAWEGVESGSRVRRPCAGEDDCAANGA